MKIIDGMSKTKMSHTKCFLFSRFDTWSTGLYLVHTQYFRGLILGVLGYTQHFRVLRLRVFGDTQHFRGLILRVLGFSKYFQALDTSSAPVCRDAVNSEYGLTS